VCMCVCVCDGTTLCVDRHVVMSVFPPQHSSPLAIPCSAGTPLRPPSIRLATPTPPLSPTMMPSTLPRLEVQGRSHLCTTLLMASLCTMRRHRATQSTAREMDLLQCTILPPAALQSTTMGLALPAVPFTTLGTRIRAARECMILPLGPIRSSACTMRPTTRWFARMLALPGVTRPTLLRGALPVSLFPLVTLVSWKCGCCVKVMPILCSRPTRARNSK
jgi:hypothetical protein